MVRRLCEDFFATFVTCGAPKATHDEKGEKSHIFSPLTNARHPAAGAIVHTRKRDMIVIDDSDFAPIDDFPLLWRWNDESHGLFLPQELDLIRPLKPAIARKLHDSVLAADRLNVPEDTLVIESSNKSSGDIEDWLTTLPVHETEQVVLSWTSDAAVLTIWQLFTRRWSDFWYPSSDDLTVISASTSWVLAISHYGRFEWSRRINK